MALSASGAESSTQDASQGGLRSSEGFTTFWTFYNHFFVPFWSSDYKIKVTEECIESALRRSTSTEEGSRTAGLDFDRALQPTRTIQRFLTLYYINLERTSPSVFTQSRMDLFNIPENIYQGTLRSPLTPLSSLGLSGSLFFHTSAPPPPLPEDIAQQSNAGLFIKSIGRAFEYEFMYEKLLPEYLTFMRDSQQHGGSLLSRITDVLCSRETSIGALLNMTPRHYVVMVDIIGSKKKKVGGRKWDLKPPDFFEPLRDLIPDSLTTESTREGLADALAPEDHLMLTGTQRTTLLNILDQDLAFLEKMEVIDYSLLLGRWPADLESEVDLPIGFIRDDASDTVARGESATETPLSADELDGGTACLNHSVAEGRMGDADQFIRGIKSADGKWIYRMSIVDFMWNINKLHPMAAKTAGKVLPEQTTTTEPSRYRQAFFEMMELYVDAYDV